MPTSTRVRCWASDWRGPCVSFGGPDTSRSSLTFRAAWWPRCSTIASFSNSSPLLPGWQRLERWIDQQPQAILASSNHAANLLVQRFGIPGGTSERTPRQRRSPDVSPTSEVSSSQLAGVRKRFGVPSDRPIVAYLGLLAPYQGTDLFFQALAQFSHHQPRPFGKLMGFPDVPHYQEMAQNLGLTGHVAFTGAVPFEEAPLCLALGDIAVAPKISATEGSGKLLTYMATGLPVVAFDTPVHREYLQDLGLYAPVGDTARLAAALEDALADPKHGAQLGLALRKRAIERFTWKQAAAQIETVYGGLL